MITAALFNFVITSVFIFFETSLALNCTTKSIQLCQCKADGHRYVVDCSHVGLKSVPKGFPTYVTHLYLDDNNIKILEKGSFNQVKQRTTTSDNNKYKKKQTGEDRASCIPWASKP